jgi:hypothetical protein
MARKLITYHLSPFLSFKTYGIACVARQTAKRGVVWCPKQPAPFISIME